MAREPLIEEQLTRSVIGAFFEVYNTIGFGFLENPYALAMGHELQLRGHRVDREVAVKIRYKNRLLCTQRLDMIVDERLVVETKSTIQLHPGALRQLYSYLKGSSLEVGLLLHFGPQPKFYRQVLTNDRKNLVDGLDGFDESGTEERDGIS